MYDKIKVLFNNSTYRYVIIGCIGIIFILCAGYILYQPNGSDYQRTINAVERAQEKQRESLKLNRDIQSSIDRSAELSHEAKDRVDRSTQYNIDIGNRINESQNAIHEARSYLERNVELFDRIERANRQRQENNQTTTDATQPVSDGGSWSSNRSSDSSVKR
nr:MAG TPA: Type II secretion system, protein M [Caudoviricetes sp.]